MKIFNFNSIDSTNTYAMNFVRSKIEEGHFDDFEPTLITADAQTAGKGRLGRSFYSPANTGIYMSLIYKIENSSGTFNPAIYTASAAVAVCRILDSFFGINTKIKWVNDIYLHEKKICGILAEGVVQNGKIAAVVIGIGINICTTDFPQDIINKAGSIGTEIKVDKNLVAQKIAEECLKIFDFANVDSTSPTAPAFSQTMQEYKNRSFILGRQITVHPVIDNASTNYHAIAIDITPDAKLIVRMDDGSIKTLDSGEISIRFN